MPQVSVVLIFLNEERFLEEAVNSVRDQTLADWELILVDDGSTDRSTSIARQLEAEDKRIRYVDHPGHLNRGMSASRNLGTAHTSAPYIAFLDADDVWEAGKLAEQVELLNERPDVAMVCGALRYWYSWNPEAAQADTAVLTGGIADRHVDPPKLALTTQPVGREPGAGVDAMVRRNVFEAVGGFEERFHGLFEDQAFLYKVFLRYPVYVSSQAWVRYRQHETSCCAQTTGTAYWRSRRIFLDWLQEYGDRLGDNVIHAAVHRARRQGEYRRLTASARGLYRRIRTRIPVGFKQRVRRKVAPR